MGRFGSWAGVVTTLLLMLMMLYVRIQLTLIILDNDVPPVRSDPRSIFVVVNDPDFDRCDVRSLVVIFVLDLYVYFSTLARLQSRFVTLPLRYWIVLRQY